MKGLPDPSADHGYPPLVAEALDLAQRLVRTRTVNPPGDEARAAPVLVEYFRRSGLPTWTLERAPGRSNVVTRWPGAEPGRRQAPSLLLLAHLDTADADPHEWSVDPWAGVVKGDRLYGRGALDLKGQVAAQAVAVASLRRESLALDGDVVVAATADEETGAEHGVRWLCTSHPRLLRTDYALTHGAGDRIELDDEVVHFCSTADRVRCTFSVELRAAGGLTMLSPETNVVTRAASVIGAVTAPHRLAQLLPEIEAVVCSLLGGRAAPENASAACGRVHAALGALVDPVLGMSVVPRRIRSDLATPGQRAACRIDFDCWVPPDMTAVAARQVVQERLGAEADTLIWEGADDRGGTRSPVGSALWEAIEDFVRRHDHPHSRLLPMCDAGMTDSHWLRTHLGTVAYGYFPMREMTTALAARCIHGPDEHLPLRDLGLQLAFYRHVVTAVCGRRHEG